MPQDTTENQPNPQDVENAQSTPLGTVVTRNLFYRDGYRNLTRIALIQTVVIFGLVIGVIALVLSAEPQDRFFATTADGRLVPMVPLSQPNLSPAAVMSWTAQAATDVMTFGFHDFQMRMQDNSKYFTRRGWANFTEALERARFLEMVQTRQQVLTAAPASAPVLIQEGVVNGIYRWVIDMPLMVTFQTGASNDSQTINLRLFVVRVPTLDNPTGLAIQQWIAR